MSYPPSASNGHPSPHNGIKVPCRDAQEILDAEFIEPPRPEDDPIADDFAGASRSPLPHSDLILQRLANLEQYLRQQQQQREQITDHFWRHQQHFEQKVQHFQEQLQRTERKLERVLHDRQTESSRRTILLLLSVFVAGVAYITVIHPLMNRSRTPQIPPAQSAPSQTVPPIAPSSVLQSVL